MRRSVYPAFDGRIRRTTFWIGHIVLALVQIGVVLLLALAGTAGLTSGMSLPLTERLLHGAVLIVSVPLAWWSASLYARRLHDLGWTGWLAALPVGSWVGRSVFAFIETWTGDLGRYAHPALMAPSVVLLLGAVVVMLACAFAPGSPTENLHGPPLPSRREGLTSGQASLGGRA